MSLLRIISLHERVGQQPESFGGVIINRKYTDGVSMAFTKAHAACRINSSGEPLLSFPLSEDTRIEGRERERERERESGRGGGRRQ